MIGPVSITLHASISYIKHICVILYSEDCFIRVFQNKSLQSFNGIGDLDIN